MLSVQELAATLDRLDREVRQGVDRGDIADVMARVQLELTGILGLQRGAIGEKAEEYRKPRWLFSFILKWTKHRHEGDFVAKQRKAMKKWDDKHRATAAGKHGGTSASREQAVAVVERPEAARMETAASGSAAERMSAAARRSAAASRSATAIGSAAVERPEAARMETEANGSAAASRSATAIGSAAASRSATAHDPAPIHRVHITAGPVIPVFGRVVIPGPRRMSHLDNLNSEEELSRRMGTPPLRRKRNVTAEEKVARRPADEAPTRTFRDIDEGSSEEESECLPLASGESEVDAPDHSVANPRPEGRRVPNPSGVYDPRCSRCSLRKLPCARDVTLAACIPCYNAKQKCDYGQQRPRRFDGNGKGKGKGKGKAKANKKRTRTEDEDEDESSSDMGRHKGVVKRSRVDPAAASGSRVDLAAASGSGPPKPLPQSAEFIADSDVESGHGMRAHPMATFPSRSRPRAAAAKANAAVAAVMAMEDQPHRRPVTKPRGAKAPAARKKTQPSREALMLARAMERIEEQDELIGQCAERIYGLEEYVTEMKNQLESLQDYAGVPIEYYEYSPSRNDAEPTTFNRVTMTREQWVARQRNLKEAEATRNEERHQSILAQQGGDVTAANEPEVMPSGANTTLAPPVDPSKESLMPGEEGEAPMDIDSEGEAEADLSAAANPPTTPTDVSDLPAAANTPSSPTDATELPAAEKPPTPPTDVTGLHAAANPPNTPTFNIIPPTPQASLESITEAQPPITPAPPLPPSPVPHPPPVVPADPTLRRTRSRSPDPRAGRATLPVPTRILRSQSPLPVLPADPPATLAVPRRVLRSQSPMSQGLAAGSSDRKSPVNRSPTPGNSRRRK